MRKKSKAKENEELISIFEDDQETTSEVEESEEVEEGLIKKISPAKWESFIEVLDFLTKDSDDAVIIRDSIIMYNYKGGSIIKVDLNEIFDGKPINLHISSAKKWTKLFKTLKDEDVNIIDEENRFTVSSGQIRLFLPKQVGSYVNSLEFPNFSKTETICDLVIQKDTRETIQKLSKGLTYIEFLIKDRQLKCVNIPNTAIYIMPECIRDADVKKLTSSNADLTLRDQIFLPYPADTYKLIIGHNLVNDSYFSYSICNSSLIKIELFEQLDNASGIDQLF